MTSKLLGASAVLVTLVALGALAITILIYFNSNSSLGPQPTPSHRSIPPVPANISLADKDIHFLPYLNQFQIGSGRSGSSYKLNIQLAPATGQQYQAAVPTDIGPKSVRLTWADTGTTLQLTDDGASADGKLEKVSIHLTSDQLFTMDLAIPLKAAHWYGGAQTKYQRWPLEQQNITLSPYVTSDIYKNGWGGVMERYWFNSERLAVTVDNNVPLWVGLNENGDGMLRLRAQYSKSTYSNFVDDLTVAHPFIKMTIWMPNQAVVQNLRQFHLAMIQNHLGKPSAIPDTRMIKYPIWSTWARYKKEINETLVYQFAQLINSHGFNNSQLEIDDEWAPAYGDTSFNSEKFKAPKELINQLHDMGFRVTIWTHPFCNFNSLPAMNPANRYSWVHTIPGQPNSIFWWDGAGVMIDPTNTTAAAWFVERFKQFLATYSIDSFKFDAGEVNWLPPSFKLASATNPNQLANKNSCEYIFVSQRTTSDLIKFVREQKNEGSAENRLVE